MIGMMSVVLMQECAERLRRLEGVNISIGQVRVECVEQSHVAAENTGEHWRMLGMKFYVTSWKYVRKEKYLCTKT